MQDHTSTRMMALPSALNYLLITDCWVMLLPAEMEDFVRICICCKVVFDRGVSLSALGSYCGVGDFSHKVKYSPIFSLKPSQDRTFLCFSERPRMIYLEAQAVGSDSVCDVTWVKWRWDQAKTPPGAAGQRVEDVAQSQPYCREDSALHTLSLDVIHETVMFLGQFRKIW